jgi:exodeoxyribonuclease VII small subunit
MEKEMTYGESVRRLQEVVADMKQENVDVDVLLDRVTEAGRLIAVCRKQLFTVDEEVKKRLEELE